MSGCITVEARRQVVEPVETRRQVVEPVETRRQVVELVETPVRLAGSRLLAALALDQLKSPVVEPVETTGGGSHGR